MKLTIQILNGKTDREIDAISVDFPKSLTFNSQFRPAQMYDGKCKKSSILLSYHITSNCPENMYGFDCGFTCIPKEGKYDCNYLGQRICEGNFQGTNCELCEPFHYPQGDCSKVCESRDDERGHYGCKEDGTKTCLRNFVGRYCTDCKRDFYGSDCAKTCQAPSQKHVCSKDGDVVCKGNFRSPGCTECLPNYYGPECSVYCVAKRGRYKCVSEAPHFLCLEDYAGPNCSECNTTQYHLIYKNSRGLLCNIHSLNKYHRS